MAKKIVVACGGTGGHAFPGLVVAAELRARGHEVVVWNSGRAIESAVLRGWDGPTFTTGAKPLALKNALALFFSILRCRREMKRFRPDALLAMGSYASLPPVLAASSCGVPVILHEANSVPGRAVDVLARFAAKTAITFSSTARYLPGRETVCTGLPVRAGIGKGVPFEGVPADAFRVFVTGGSQGAHRVNEIASKALLLVSKDLEKTDPAKKLYVVHQTGEADENAIMGFYAAAGIDARVHAFEREMNRAFATADIVVARAGASTCFELAVAGRPAFFIPLPTALRNHQHYNAECFVAAGAADEGVQETLTPRALANWLLHKIAHPEQLKTMAEKMCALATPDAAARVADLVLETAR